jgi:VWFA-related protein
MTIRRVLSMWTLAFAVPLLAENPPAETLTIDYVEVPVCVVDAAGNPVRGLTKASFEILDNKKKSEVTGFDTIDFTSPQSLRDSAGNPSAHRAFLILFDIGYSSPHGLQRAEEAAKGFVSRGVQSGDLIAVGTIDVDSGYKVLSNFTSDREATLAAIGDPKNFRAVDPLQLSAEASHSKAVVDADSGAALAGVSVAFGASPTSAEDRRYGLEQAIQLKNRQLANIEESQRQQFERQRVHRQIDWLSQLAASLRNVRGRKQIVLLSEGFDPRVILGRTASDTTQENEESAAIINGTWYTGDTVDTDRRFGSSASINTLQVLRQAFTGSDVVLNALDIEGVRFQESSSQGALVKSNDGLFLLADPTGGTVFKNSNDLANDFSRMLHQQEFVYILGFQNKVTNPGKLHDLQVKVTGLPSGARVLARQGYFEGGTRHTPTERSLNTADVIVRDIPQDGVHIASLVVPFPAAAANDKATVPYVLEINGADLLSNAVGNDIAAELFVYAFDEQGIVRGRIYDRLALDAAQTGDKLRANGVKYVASLSLMPGKYAIKTLVRIAGTDKMGYVRTDIEVPKPGEMALLAPFVLDDPALWLLLPGAKSGAPPYPFQVNGEPFVPSVTGRIASDQVRKVAVFVANAQPEELTWETSPQATLLAQVKGNDATKLILQLDSKPVATSRFGVTVHKAGVVMRASAPLIN